MKKLIMAVLSACLLVSLACFAACEVLKPVLSVKDGITSVAPGGSVELLVEVDGKVNPEGTTFTIQHGESYSSIDQATGVLTVKENAVPGSFVTVFAEYSGASTADYSECKTDSSSKLFTDRKLYCNTEREI